MAAQPAVHRVPCAWCRERDRWPDLCPNGDEVCADIIALQCELEDHRRCEPDACAWAEQFLVAVIAAGVAECGRTGKRFAVVSTVEDDGEVKALRAFDRTQQAKPFRTQYGRRKGLGHTALHGLIVVVREDGALV